MHSGRTVLPIAEAHQGERYVLGARVPMDNETFHGPWDCAEFVSWCVYQAYGVLFGVRPANPQTADAYTGYWTEDALASHATIAVSQALNTPGAILLRRPRSQGSGPRDRAHRDLAGGRQHGRGEGGAVRCCDCIRRRIAALGLWRAGSRRRICRGCRTALCAATGSVDGYLAADARGRGRHRAARAAAAWLRPRRDRRCLRFEDGSGGL
jgi:hypothetical protein